jgi:hypothetical protein
VKVRDLIESLKVEDPDAEVFLTHCMNDHWGTVVAAPVHSCRADDLVWSEQYECWVEDDGDGMEDHTTWEDRTKDDVVVLS